MRCPIHTLSAKCLLGWLLTFVPISSAILHAADGPVTALAFAPSGETLLVGSQNGVAEVSWPRFERLRELPSKVGHVHDIAFSPSGWLAAVAGGSPAQEGTIEILEWPAGTIVRQWSPHADLIYGLAWSGDSQRLAAASFDHGVSLWGMGEGEPVQRFTGHSRGVTAVAMLPGGEFLVSAGYDNSLRVWQTGSSRPVRALNNHTAPIHALAVRPAAAGPPLVATTSEDRTVRFWQPTIGRLMRFRRLDCVPLAIAWIPTTSHVAVTTDAGTLIVVDAADARLVEEQQVCDGWAYSLAVHPLAKEAVVGGQAGKLYRVVLGQAASSD